MLSMFVLLLKVFGEIERRVSEDQDWRLITRCFHLVNTSGEVDYSITD